ncbi:MAG: SMP-30/gluconolactonase/LRE family protein [Chitinophagaceae bacterium]|nr:SMP-30/gluconolactonase/LRE family protein [Chitinophagaceae bacterium]
MKLSCIVLPLLFAGCFCCEVCSQSIVAKGASLQEAGSGFAFTEGPVSNKKGEVYFTDQPNNRIWKYADGKLSVYMEPAGRANGMFFDRAGNLIACADEHSELWQIKKDKSVQKLVVNYKDSTLNGPNDVWVAPSGVIYFTDPYYQRDYWTRQNPEMKIKGLYMLTPGGALLQVDGDFKQPNGIIGTGDGKTLYVADIGDSKIYRYTIGKDGIPVDKTMFVPEGCDGMTVDVQGNIYLAGNGVTVYNKEGNKIDHIDVPAKWTSNVCFSGKKRNILFITASEKIFTIQTNTKGVK